MSRTLRTAVYLSLPKRIAFLLLSAACALALIFSGGERAGAAGGGLDPAFNPSGSGANDPVNVVAMQPDGKILIGGEFTGYNGDAAASDNIARLNADGTLDAIFNPGGAGADGPVYAVALQPDGKILIGGDFIGYNGDAAASDGIARLNSNGTLDTSFNNGGAGLYHAPSVGPGNTLVIVVQPDGKILIGGSFTSYNGDADANDYIARLNADGTLDASFNSNGVGAEDFVAAIALQPDGKIVIGGDFVSYNGAGSSAFIERLNSDGTLDTSFNSGGVGPEAPVQAVALQPDGKIIIGGRDFTSYNGDAAASDRIARLNTDGTLDTSFDSGDGADSHVYTVAVQGDGKIIIGGLFTSYDGDAAASDGIARLNSNGTLDTSFNSGGAGADIGVNSVVLQTDGKILIGGNFASYNGDSNATDYIARLLPATGALAFSSATYNADETAGDATITLTRTGGTDNQLVAKVSLTDVTTSAADYRFAPGSVDTSFTPGMGADSVVWSVAVQADGKILIGGNFLNYDGTARAHIARLNANGTLDATFNPGTGANGIVYAIAPQPDGRIIIGGAFTDYDGAARAHLARLNSDGTLDTSFNPNPGTGTNFDVRAILLQPDGKPIIGGEFSTYNGTSRGRVARLHTDGTLDTTFDPGTGANISGVYTMALQPDGKLIIAGGFTMYDGTARGRVARINADGSLDATFNSGTGVDDSIVWGVAVQPDGKIIIGGNFTSFNGTARNRLIRVNADGTHDPSFNPPIGPSAVVWTTSLQPDGKVIVCGNFATYDGVSRNRIARVNADGTLDTTFSPGAGATGTIFTATPLQPDGRLIVGGSFMTYNSASRVRVARVNGDFFVTWPAGDTTDKTIQLPIVNDGVNESPDETLNLALAVMSGGAALGSPNAAVLTILDPNDAPVNTVPAAQTTGENTAKLFSTGGANQISIEDSDGGTNAVRVTLTATKGTVTLSGTSGLSFITGDGTSDATTSFTGTVANINTALNGLVFNPTLNYSGAAALQIVTNDQGATGAGGAKSDTDAVSITVNEGGSLKLSAATYSINESAGTMTINVTRTGGSGGAATVKYATTNGTATGYTSCAAGKDYVTKTGTLSWADGDMTNKTFVITVCNDAVYEGNETVNLTLSNVTGGASLSTPRTAVLTVVDDETQPKLSVNSVMLNEGNSGAANATFAVTLSGPSSKSITVKYATANTTAVAPGDYTALPLTTLTFSPGQVSKNVSVPVKGDLVDELDETFKLVLSSPTNATIAVSQGVCTIKDNDTATISINNVSVAEPDSSTVALTFTVKLSVASSRTVSVRYQTANGTATAPADYTAKALTTLSFSPGVMSLSVTVLVKGELLVEPNENLFVNLSSPVNATISDSQGLGTIINDD